MSDRRTFLKQILTTGAVVSLGGLSLSCDRQGPIPGRLLGANAKTGHLLREPAFPQPQRTESHAVVIIGGGVAGLSAAWELARKGQDFLLLELAEKVGGNAMWGENEVSAYPWGAHYLPVPSADNPDLLELLTDLEVIRGFSSDGLPLFEESYLCFSPHERLLLNGIWQEGLIPNQGVPAQDKEEIAAFFAFMEEMKAAQGIDGKPAFSIPIAEGSEDPDFLRWDQLSMAEFMDQQGWHSPYLRWYVNYCCRDDFGTPLAQTSAWAGIHYFASRKGGGLNADASEVLTWPEGNGWLVRQLEKRFREKIRCNALVTQVGNKDSGVGLSYWDVKKEEMVAIEAGRVIFCGPQFVGTRVIPELSTRNHGLFSYVPWVTANVTLSQLPKGTGAPLSWDNVSYSSDSLGYIHAAHQQMTSFAPRKTVITWYQVLSGGDPQAMRKAAYERTEEEWKAAVLDDLEQMHPGIGRDIARIDLWIWGHGMIRPVPGLISSEGRKQAALPLGNIHFAHSDLSGISIFEEAFYHGVRAAREVIAHKESTV